jgi:hypothetical protein
LIIRFLLNRGEHRAQAFEQQASARFFDPVVQM